MDTEAVLRELLALAEAELRSAQEKIEKLKAERFGLELALARHRGEPAPSAASMDDSTPTPGKPSEWQRLGRAEAAERALQEAGGPIHRKCLQAKLHEHGRDDSLEHLSAALAYLNRSERAVSKGHGMWVHPDHDTTHPDHDDTRETNDIGDTHDETSNGASASGDGRSPDAQSYEGVVYDMN